MVDVSVGDRVVMRGARLGAMGAGSVMAVAPLGDEVTFQARVAWDNGFTTWAPVVELLREGEAAAVERRPFLVGELVELVEHVGLYPAGHRGRVHAPGMGQGVHDVCVSMGGRADPEVVVASSNLRHVEVERSAGPVEGAAPTGASVVGASVGEGSTCCGAEARPSLAEIDDMVTGGGSRGRSSLVDLARHARGLGDSWREWPTADGYWWASSEVNGAWSRPVIVASHQGIVCALGSDGALTREQGGESSAVYRWAGLVEPAPPGVE